MKCWSGCVPGKRKEELVLPRTSKYMYGSIQARKECFIAFSTILYFITRGYEREAQNIPLWNHNEFTRIKYPIPNVFLSIWATEHSPITVYNLNKPQRETESPRGIRLVNRFCWKYCVASAMSVHVEPVHLNSCQVLTCCDGCELPHTHSQWNDSPLKYQTRPNWQVFSVELSANTSLPNRGNM